MKRFILTLAAVAALAANAEVYTFDFNKPTTLVPEVIEPGLKEYINIAGRTFTCGPVTATFTASDYGNTHVRIYHSYDAGIDVRLYDGDALTVSVPDNMMLKSIQFTMSLSGAASGTNDINFISDKGDFAWEDERWAPDADSAVSTVELTSAEQSRIYTMSVDVEESSSISEITETAAQVRYYSLSGIPVVAPAASGVYIKVSGNRATTIFVK